MADPVHEPSHYAIAGDIEALDIINAALKALNLTPYQGYLLGNFLKYRLRLGDKDAVEQDLAKSNKYRGWLRDSLRRARVRDARGKLVDIGKLP